MRVGLAVVRGRSMEPTYVDGDRLVVLHGAVPRVGRAHVIRLPPGADGPRPIAVKRLVRHTGTGWWAEGDNPSASTDSRTVGEISDADLIARVLLRLPGFGLPRWWVRLRRG